MESGYLQKGMARGSLWLLFLLLWSLDSLPSVHCQSCRNGILTYEKLTGYKSNARKGSRILPRSKSLTLDCLEDCQSRSDCLGFQTDYTANECQSFTQDSSTPINRNLIAPDTTKNYFEKLCLENVNTTYFRLMCASKMWAFERVKDASLEVPAALTRRVATRQACVKLCFITNEFTCRAANYESATGICALMREDRRTQAQAFRANNSGWDYIENQCSVRLIQSCEYSTLVDVVIAKPDHVTYAPSRENCTAKCDETKKFFCRSYSYDDSGNICALSSGDKTSVGAPTPAPGRGIISGERTCLLLQCAGSSASYEKVTGYYIQDAIALPLDLDEKFSSVACLQACTNSGTSCPAIHVDYSSEQCFKLDRNTQDSGTNLVARQGISYFEQICLKGAARYCLGKAWVYQRILRHEMIPSATDRVLRPVQNRRKCEEACLNARGSFTCKAATYYSMTTECRLSDKSRRSHPDRFRPSTTDGVEYLENECAALTKKCHFVSSDNFLPLHSDMMTTANSQKDCENACANNANFTCRSAGFRPSSAECRLSSEEGLASQRTSHEGGTFFQCTAQKTSNSKTVSTTDNSHQCFHRSYIRTSGVWAPGGPVMLESNFKDGVVEECCRICDRNESCVGFSVDFSIGRCYMTQKSDNDTVRLEVASSTGYFQTLCLPKTKTCQQLWAFKRIPNKELRGFDREVYRDISKSECLRRCLVEKRFSCRSVSYNRRICRLSSENHITRPDSLNEILGSDYLINECVERRRQNVLRRRETMKFSFLSRQSNCKFINRIVGQGLSFNDRLLQVITERDCQRLCMNETGFNCHSYTFVNQGKIGSACYLSSETRASMGARMRDISNAIYMELQCGSSTGMTTIDPGFPTPPRGGGDGDGTTENGGNGGDGNGGGTGSPVDGESGCMDPEDLTFERIMGRMPTSAPKKTDEEENLTPASPTTTCLQNCIVTGNGCKGVALHYSGGVPYNLPCSIYEKALGPDSRALQTRADTAYFEKICVRGKKCNSIWAFERIPGYALVGFESKTIQDVRSREGCMEKCLEQKLCRSAQYVPRARMCRLSAETRRSQPFAFRFQGGGVQYMENQCTTDPSSCNFVDIANSFLPYADLVINDVESLADCREECGKVKNFKCRSVSYDSKTKNCSVSACDRHCNPTTRTMLIQKMGSTYSERSSCTPQGGNQRPRPRPHMMPFPPPLPPPPPPPPHLIPHPPPPPPPGFPHPPRPNFHPKHPASGRTDGVEPRRREISGMLEVSLPCKSTYLRITGMAPDNTSASITMNVSDASTFNCITECTNLGENCLAFMQEQGACVIFQDVPTELNRRESVSFFRKICLQGRICSKLWAFDHQPGYEVRGFDRKRVLNVESIEECAQLCSNEAGFPCRSAEFSIESRICRLSGANRYSHPAQFQKSLRSDVQYLENQCRAEND